MSLHYGGIYDETHKYRRVCVPGLPEVGAYFISWLRSWSKMNESYPELGVQKGYFQKANETQKLKKLG